MDPLKKTVKILSLFLSVWIGLCCCARTSVAARPSTEIQPLGLSAHSACLMAEDGSVLFEKNADARMGPASTTKLMTALVIAESLAPDQPIRIPREAVGIEGSSIYLTEGEILTVRELLYALLLSSANDAATALALTLSGSVEAFAETMNRRARVLNLENTHFQNPHGLADDDHYTTARDLARIALEVLRNPLLADICATYKTTIPQGGIADRRLLVNHNKLLRSYEGAMGMKTGFTKKTGRTLVSAARRNGMTLIAVTLNAPDDWRDHTALLDYGFSGWERFLLADVGGFHYEIPLTGGTKETAVLSNTAALSLILPKQRQPISVTVESPFRFLFAPTLRGDCIGKITVVCEDKSVTSPLIVTESVAQRK